MARNSLGLYASANCISCQRENKTRQPVRRVREVSQPSILLARFDALRFRFPLRFRFVCFHNRFVCLNLFFVYVVVSFSDFQTKPLGAKISGRKDERVIVKVSEFAAFEVGLQTPSQLTMIHG